MAKTPCPTNSTGICEGLDPVVTGFGNFMDAIFIPMSVIMVAIAVIGIITIFLGAIMKSKR